MRTTAASLKKDFPAQTVLLHCPGSLEVRMPPCHGSDPGSIPGQGVTRWNKVPSSYSMDFRPVKHIVFNETRPTFLYGIP